MALNPKFYMSARVFDRSWRRHFATIKECAETFGTNDYTVLLWASGGVPVPRHVITDLRLRAARSRPPSQRARSGRGRPPDYSVATPDGDYAVGSSRVDLQACKLEYSIVSPK